MVTQTSGPPTPPQLTPPRTGNSHNSHCPWTVSLCIVLRLRRYYRVLSSTPECENRGTFFPNNCRALRATKRRRRRCQLASLSLSFSGRGASGYRRRLSDTLSSLRRSDPNCSSSTNCRQLWWGRESEDGREEGASAPLQTGPPRQQPRSSLARSLARSACL